MLAKSRNKVTFADFAGNNKFKFYIENFNEMFDFVEISNYLSCR